MYALRVVSELRGRRTRYSELMFAAVEQRLEDGVSAVELAECLQAMPSW